MQPLQLSSGEGKENPLPPMLAFWLSFVISLSNLFLSFVIFLVSAVLVDFIDDREPDATGAALHMQPRPPLRLTFQHFSHRSLRISLSLSSLSYSVSFEQRSWCRTQTAVVEGRKIGSKATYPSLVNAATVCHSISVLSFHLSGHLVGQHHPTQIKRFREFV
jgi:hypothetical protein